MSLPSKSLYIIDRQKGRNYNHSRNYSRVISTTAKKSMIYLEHSIFTSLPYAAVFAPKWLKECRKYEMGAYNIWHGIFIYIKCEGVDNYS